MRRPARDLVRYTALTTWWAPLVAVGVLALVLGAAIRRSGDGTPFVVSALVAGAVAAALSLALTNPAHALLEATPVSAVRRTVLRLALVVPVAAAAWWLHAPRLLGLGGAAANTVVGIAAPAALAATGVAVYCLVDVRVPDRAAAAGASVALGWAVAAVIDGDGLLAPVSTLWLDHPVPIAVAALALALCAPHAQLRRFRAPTALHRSNLGG